MKTRLMRSRSIVDLLVVEDGEDLSGDFAGGEIAVQAEKGRHAELAVDGAADLGGDADGGAGGEWLVAGGSVAR